MLIGQRVRTWRTAGHLSQSDLAARVDLSQRQISRIERDDFTTLRRATLVHIAEALRAPVASGEVNIWLAQCGYAPLVRPGLPLPPIMHELAHDAVGRLVFDPSGALRTTNAVGQSLVRQFADRWEDFNLLGFTLSDTVGLSPGDRDRLRYWMVLLALGAPPEPWAARVRTQIEMAWRQNLEAVWSGLQEEVDLPGYWEAPLTVHVSQEALRFFPNTQTYPLRPDLQILYLTPADSATLAWCRRYGGADAFPALSAAAPPVSGGSPGASNLPGEL